MSVGDPTQRLLDGETVIWQGRPCQGLLLSGRDVFLIPFSVLWAGFAIFWEASVIASPAPVFFQLWGVPFVLAGVYMIAGRFFIDAWLRSKTRYAVTNRRVLLVRSGPFSKITSLSLDRLPEVQLTERADGRGTLRFGPAPVYWGWSQGAMGYWSPALDPTPQFIGIDDARRVFDQIQRAIRGAG